MWTELQSIHDTYEQIIQGERLWTALGDFLNYWYSYAASVEYLCERHQISCPDWVNGSTYILTDAWFTGLGASKAHVKVRL